MKERPILFSGAMVQAILDGRKTQTRRVGKCQKDDATELGVEHIGHATRGTVAQATYRAFPQGGTARWALCECPYGVTGDRLWVRETFSLDATSMYPCPNVWYRATDGIELPATHTCPKDKQLPWADCLACWEDRNGKFKWRPSIFMPRWACRIELEITQIRVERLRDITTADIDAEGVDNGHSNRMMCKRHDAMQRMEWEKRWDSINAKRGYGWETNPWVWAITFKRSKP